MLIFSGLPLLLLGYIILFDVPDRRFLRIANFASLCVVLQVLFMRFNVVIGGQMISKSEPRLRGLPFQLVREGRHGPCPHHPGRAFRTYFILSRLLPIFSDDASSASGSRKR